MAKNAGLPRTVQGALQNARAALGKNAEQDVHFVVVNTGAGFDWRKLSRGVSPQEVVPKAPVAGVVKPIVQPGRHFGKTAATITTERPTEAIAKPKPRKPRAPLPPVIRASELPDAPKAAKRPVAAKKRKPLPKAAKPKKAAQRTSKRTPRAS